MKTVFTNAQCAHVWAQQTQEHGRGASLSFRGATAYSYSTAVAAIVAGRDRNVALVTSLDYSVTTAKHKSILRRAVGSTNIFTVPDVSASFGDIPHARNLGYLVKQYNDELALLARVPCESWRLRDLDPTHGPVPSEGIDYWDLATVGADDASTAAHIRLRSLAATAFAYAREFGQPTPGLAWKKDSDAVIARRDRLMSSPEAVKRIARKAIVVARREADRKERNRIYLLALADQIIEWRAGAKLGGWNYRDPDTGSSYFRLNGDNVETSQGATVPIEHVRRVMRFYAALRAHGALPWSREGTNAEHADYTLGHFRLDSIDANGGVRAGCHYFSAAEVEHLAVLLGLRVVESGT